MSFVSAPALTLVQGVTVPPDGMRPDLDWGHAARQFAAETGAQNLICVTCAMDEVYDPPARVVIMGGYSYCLPHGLNVNNSGMQAI